MTYEEFKNHNDKLLTVAYKTTEINIEDVDYIKDTCKLSIGVEISLDDLVTMVTSDKGCVKNPELIEDWCGFSTIMNLSDKAKSFVNWLFYYYKKYVDDVFASDLIHINNSPNTWIDDFTNKATLNEAITFLQIVEIELLHQTLIKEHNMVTGLLLERICELYDKETQDILFDDFNNVKDFITLFAPQGVSSVDALNSVIRFCEDTLNDSISSQLEDILSKEIDRFRVRKSDFITLYVSNVTKGVSYE